MNDSPDSGRRVTFRILLASIALLGATGSLNAQEEPAAGRPYPEFDDLVEVSEVLLDVLATDRKGAIVRGLGKDDFLVLENGKPVELTGVSFYTTRYDEAKTRDQAAAADSASGETAAEVPASRFFIFFFHEQRHLSTILSNRSRQQRAAGRQAHDWVRDEMYPSDWVAVVSHDAHLHVHQDFSQDRESLMAAISDAARGFQPEDPTLSEWKRAAAASALSLRRGLPAPPELARATRRIYHAIRLVAEATRPIVGRKNLLLFTLGFGEFEEFALGSRPDQRYYPAMAQALNDNNVALYPIDLTHRDVVHSQGRFFLQLATDSGGLYYPNLVSFKSRLERIAAENSGYYLLSFRTTHAAGESGYRRVTVKAKDRRIRVRARRGYRYGI